MAEDAMKPDRRFLQLLDFLADHYFHARLLGDLKSLSSSQKNESVIYAVNHSGMNFPWDCKVLYALLLRTISGTFTLRPLSAPVLFKSRMLQPFGVDHFWRSMLCAEASTQTFEKAILDNENILVNPEGIGGIAKGFDKKYQLQPFSTSFVRLALKHHKEIIPIYAVNGEYLNPFAYNLEGLNRLARKFGIPFLSVGLFTPLYILFPFAIYISLPARLRYIPGGRIRVWEMAGKDHDQMSADELRALTDKVRLQMQAELQDCVGSHSACKFAVWEILQSLPTLGWRSLWLFPPAWPFLFHRAETGRSWGRKLWSFFGCISMTVPLAGWPLYLLYLKVSGPPLSTQPTAKIIPPRNSPEKVENEFNFPKEKAI